jgi:hypothetical protein
MTRFPRRMQYRVEESGNDANEYIPLACLGKTLIGFQARRVDYATPGEWHEEVRSGSRSIEGFERFSRVWKCFMRTLEGLVSIFDLPHSQTTLKSSP